jgi:hypothetical protein
MTWSCFLLGFVSWPDGFISFPLRVVLRHRFEDAQDGGWDFGTVREPGLPNPVGMHTNEDVRWFFMARLKIIVVRLQRILTRICFCQTEHEDE